MTYFHTGCSTIIGAKSFHGPVRDGKGWCQLAMVIRHDLFACRSLPFRSNVKRNREEVVAKHCLAFLGMRILFRALSLTYLRL